MITGRHAFNFLRNDIQTGCATLSVSYPLDNDKGGRRVILNTVTSDFKLGLIKRTVLTALFYMSSWTGPYGRENITKT